MPRVLPGQCAGWIWESGVKMAERLIEAAEEALRARFEDLERAIIELRIATTGHHHIRSRRVMDVEPADPASAGPPPPRFRSSPPACGDRPPVKFCDVDSPPRPVPPEFEGLHDAFTGAPLDPSAGLYQCSRCGVYYHSASFDLLKAENQGRCVACLAVGITRRELGPAVRPGRNAAPRTVTLADYKQHVGRVITFEGTVRRVHRSLKGGHLAAMFEDTTWSKGLKLVFFKRTVGRAGGIAAIEGLSGRTVRVRGLLVHHRFFGYQIVINNPSMIQSVV